MSQLYDDYLKEHVTNVGKAWVWMWDNLPVSPVYGMEIENLVRMHDMSKTKRDEYRAYDDYFYGGNRSTRLVEFFLQERQPARNFLMVRKAWPWHDSAPQNEEPGREHSGADQGKAGQGGNGA